MGRLSRAHTIILLVAAVVCLLTFQGTRTLTEHEVFAAQPGREMLAGHGWLLQPFAGEYRTKKPPGQSWLIAASLGVTRSHSEWAARLPSALAGIGLAVIVARMAAGLGTSRIGLIAGLMTLTCVGVQQRARLAEADMALAFCVALANAMVFSSLSRYAGGGLGRGDAGISTAPMAEQTLSLTLSHAYKGEGTRLRAVTFWAAIVAGFMLKGPIVLGFTLLPTVVAWGVLRFGTKDRSAATALARTAFWWPAVVAGVALIVAWPVAAAMTYPPALDQWKREIFDRMAGKVRGGDETRKDPLFAYVWLLPQSTLPWGLFALAAVGTAWHARRRPANVLLIAWGGVGVLFVSAIAFKVLHYVLPAVAPVLILAAFGFDRLLTRWQRSRPRASRAAWERVSIAGWFGAAAAGWLVWAGAVVPTKDWGREVRAFARAVDAAVPAGQTIYFYHPGDDRSGEDQTAWYFDHPLRQTETLPDARPAYLICGKAEAATLGKDRNATVLEMAGSYIAREGKDRNDRALVRLD